MSNFMSRTLTGIIYVAVIVAGICVNNYTFAALSCLLAGLGVAEFTRITGQRSTLTTLVDVAGAMIVVLGFDTSVMALRQGWSFPYAATWGMLFTAWLILRIVMQLYSHNPAPLRVLATSLMAQLYIALPIGLMSVIYNHRAGHALLLAVFIMIWLNDTGAFLVGSRIGRRKLFERLSPKKSWEGFFGGMAFSIASAFVFYYGFATWYGCRPLWVMVTLGVIVPVFATWGDLAESMIKRTLKVKDSGHLLPGHGGILDRIDSLLIAVPAVTVFLTFLDLLLG